MLVIQIPTQIESNAIVFYSLLLNIYFNLAYTRIITNKRNPRFGELVGKEKRLNVFDLA